MEQEAREKSQKSLPFIFQKLILRNSLQKSLPKDKGKLLSLPKNRSQSTPRSGLPAAITAQGQAPSPPGYHPQPNLQCLTRGHSKPREDIKEKDI